ncbi:MAG TPA: Tol-Pal system beta propeller repeat protein TolB [Kofleriaceae bacterium]|nr:Tol-Pal system beta propeller repeat protein TolB [Kofleriaceae bacterium]
MKPLLAALLCATLLGGEPTAASADGTTVVIDVNNTKRILYPIGVPMGSGDAASAKLIAEVASFDLGVSGWFRVLDPRSFLADLDKEALEIDPPKWKNVGAFGVMKYRVTSSGGNVEITFKLYEVEKGNVAVLSRTYSGQTRELRGLVHKWCNDVVKYYTGEESFFGSKIAFVTKRKGGGKQIQAMDFDGQNVYGLTRNRSLNILPSWSPSGGSVAFTSYMRRNPDLYVVGAGGGRPKKVASYYGMNTGASWSPDGSKLAVTLSKDGNPEIYLISASNGAIISRLTNNRAIDTSPTWSPDGKEIAFVSDRDGGPQIFVMSSNGSNQRRVSFNGNYNTTPDWSPRKGTRTIAYTTRDGGVYDIVTIDLITNKMTRITQGEGVNEEPSFAANGMAIAFSSSGRKTGSGIYIANADGTGEARKVWSGSATSVDWGPTP